jgi:hypothetical protein
LVLNISGADGLENCPRKFHLKLLLNWLFSAIGSLNIEHVVQVGHGGILTVPGVVGDVSFKNCPI